MTDGELAGAIHKKFYGSMPRIEFDREFFKSFAPRACDELPPGYVLDHNETNAGLWRGLTGAAAIFAISLILGLLVWLIGRAARYVLAGT